MKAMRLVCILALAVSVAACGDSSDGNGGDGGGGSGGDGGGGDGGSGGALVDQCTNSADESVYEDAGDGNLEDGQDAVSSFATACSTGECGNLFGIVIGDPSDENVQALADCVIECTGNEYDLSNGCLTCYGDVVSCGGANCVGACAADPSSELCDQCLIDNGCTGGFEDCSGIGSSIE